MTSCTPQTFMVGNTQPDFEGIRDYLVATDQMEFYTEFANAYDEFGSIALCSMYAKMCYRSLVMGKNENVRGNRDIAENIAGCFDMGHGAVFEHVSLNFVTVNCSRVFTHELVRHRVGTAFSQTSGRYCTPENAQMVLPPNLPDNVKGAFLAHLEQTKALIRDARITMKVDDMPMAERKKITSALRRVMPSGADNEIGWTVNIRSLRHLLELRTSPHAEWEIRQVFTDVGREIQKRFPMMLTGGLCTFNSEDGLDVWTGLKV